MRLIPSEAEAARCELPVGESDGNGMFEVRLIESKRTIRLTDNTAPQDHVKVALNGADFPVNPDVQKINGGFGCIAVGNDRYIDGLDADSNGQRIQTDRHRRELVRR